MCARRAAARTLVLDALGRRAADPAVPMRAVPLDELCRAGSHLPLGGGQGHHRGAQRHPPPARRHRVQPQRPSIEAAQTTKVVAHRRIELRPRQNLFVALGEQQLAFDERE